MTGLKALEGWWDVSYSGDHYQHLLHIQVAAALLTILYFNFFFLIII